MTERDEDRLVRIPTRTKDNLGLNNGDLVLIGDRTLYVADATEEDIYKVGEVSSFVSSSTYESLPHDTDVKPIPADVTIGCDPEFILVSNQRKIVEAGRVFKREGQIGNDAGLGELRPDPSIDTPGLMRNIQSLIKRIPSITEHRPYGFTSIRGWMLGFHVHLGIPQEVLSYASEKHHQFMRSLIYVMDFFVGVPSVLADKSDARRLSLGPYGKGGDYRIKECTIEYRTPGGIHLSHPEYTRTLLETSHVVCKDIIGRGMLLTKGWSRMENFYSFSDVSRAYNIPSSKELLRAINNPDRAELRELNSRAEEEVKKLHGYGRSERFIAPFFKPRVERSHSLLDNW